MFFAPQGRHVAPMGGEIWHGGGVQISPHRCNDKGIGPQKLKFLVIFHQNVEYKRPAGAYPLRDFHKICRVCTSFQDALGVKILLDLLKVLQVQERARGPVSACQVWLGSDFTRSWGSQKR